METVEIVRLCWRGHAFIALINGFEGSRKLLGAIGKWRVLRLCVVGQGAAVLLGEIIICLNLSGTC